MRKARTAAIAGPTAKSDLIAEGRWPQTAGMRIGISGWNYRGWRGVFYPKGISQRRELGFASRAFNSIEINGSFYSLQRPNSYRRWYEETPPGFIFSVKGARFITHMKKLRDVEAPLANFFASGVLYLGDKLGPILWQFPPNFGWNPERFEDFFNLLPRDTSEAAKLSRQHDEKVGEHVWTKTDATRPLRYAVEIRHTSFLVPEFFNSLRRHNIAFVFADTAGKWPYVEDLTADFVYCRLHGDEILYVSGYSDSALAWWANRLAHWHESKQPGDAKLILPHPRDRHARDVYIYFDNDAKVHAPFDAKRLAQHFGIEPLPFDHSVAKFVSCVTRE